MAMMKKKTVNVPGIGPVELYYGAGTIGVDDLPGIARVEAQGYTLAELQASTREGRRPVPLHRQGEYYEGLDYQELRNDKPELVAAIQNAVWDGLTRRLNVPTDELDGDGKPIMVNYFDDAVDVQMGQ